MTLLIYSNHDRTSHPFLFSSIEPGRLRGLARFYFARIQAPSPTNPVPTPPNKLWNTIATLLQHSPAQPEIACKLALLQPSYLPAPQVHNTGHGSAIDVWVEVETRGNTGDWVTYFIDTIGTLRTRQGYIAARINAGSIQDWFTVHGYGASCAVRLRCSWGRGDRVTLERLYILSWECNESHGGGWVLREMIEHP